MSRVCDECIREILGLGEILGAHLFYSLNGNNNREERVFEWVECFTVAVLQAGEEGKEIEVPGLTGFLEVF